ncbi:MAG: PAS domain-containing protein [Planctomycetes bacterium]|nr:PAS domain-containing protein [Planctomycetota bacterium]
MDRQHPIYTIETKCQDCYKCVRQCPVKAIKVRNGHAAVIPELCVACGHCVKVCPAQAKKVRNDLGRASYLLETGRPVYVSIAPSWVGEFKEISSTNMIAAIKKLGATGVSETAIGAQEVSAVLGDWISDRGPGLWISSACPAAVEFITRYLPEYRDRITPIASPALAHARMLRKEFGENIVVIFIGPCPAKKLEVDLHPDLMQLALTFEDLHNWFKEEGIDPAKVEVDEDNDKFVPYSSKDGALYPLEGGMIETIKVKNPQRETQLLPVSGLRSIDNLLAGANSDIEDKTVMLECLACAGGCINGPCMSRGRTSLSSMLEVRHRADAVNDYETKMKEEELILPLPESTCGLAEPDEEEIRKALARVGKEKISDELNCGGCGYDTCRQFASALINGNAEPAMCSSHMRKIAQRKANALLRCIPDGVVIVDRDLKVVECNRAFADLFGEATQLAYDAQPGLEGAFIDRILPFHELFRTALRTGQDVSRERLPVGDKLFTVSIFPIEPKWTVGAIIQDVTETELKREQIARRAREVIQKNLVTVQEIACRLGEHMADTEILLSSIADDYGPDMPTIEEPEKEG